MRLKKPRSLNSNLIKIIKHKKDILAKVLLKYILAQALLQISLGTDFPQKKSVS